VTVSPGVFVGYKRGADGICHDATRLSARRVMRLQLLPEQEKRPSAQASTRSVSIPFR
jgi:hypothetical protein